MFSELLGCEYIFQFHGASDIYIYSTVLGDGYFAAETDCGFYLQVKVGYGYPY